jgi:RNA binding motif
VQGDTEGFVRFDTADSAKTALAKADTDGKVELVDGDDKRTAGIALVTGDEEQALIDKVHLTGFLCGFLAVLARSMEAIPVDNIEIDGRPLSISLK